MVIILESFVRLRTNLHKLTQSNCFSESETIGLRLVVDPECPVCFLQQFLDFRPRDGDTFLLIRGSWVQVPEEERKTDKVLTAFCPFSFSI